MYTEFFCLNEFPFNSTLDPKYFFPSPQHEEALASLVYAVQERKGMVVVTGDVGSGKTLLSHMLINRLGQSAEVATLTNSHLVGMDLLQGICREFQLPTDSSYNTMELLATLEEFLLAQHSKERVAVLILDDAQALADSHFEQLRLAANLEVANGKLLQIVLLGQHDLHSRLQKPSLKQLSQRIFRSVHIPPLSAGLTEKYIQFRLRAAGLESENIFDEETYDLIHKYSSGVPRLINNLCDNLLLSAYSAGVQVVNAGRANEVINEMMAMLESPSDEDFSSSPDDVDRAISEITTQYVNSLEAQISELESTSADTDQRIHELHRLSAKLQAQELKFNEHQMAIDSKVRDLHRLTVTLQEQEKGLSLREKSLSARVEELRALSERLDSQDKKLAEREAKMAQQLRDIDRLSAIRSEQSAAITEQDQRLTERADYIEQKLASRQVAFDRELNDCKRAINRKWQEIKQFVVEYESKESERMDRLASLDRRLERFENIEKQFSKQESALLATIEEVSKTQNELTESNDHLTHLIDNAAILLDQPQEIMAKASQQMERVERMTHIVQQATESLQKAVERSLAASRTVNADAERTCRRLEDVDSDAVSIMKDLADQSGKTHKLREVLKQIYDRAESRVMNIKSQSDEAVKRQEEMLQTISEQGDTQAARLKELQTGLVKHQEEMLQTISEQGDTHAARLKEQYAEVVRHHEEMLQTISQQSGAQVSRLNDQIVEAEKRQAEALQAFTERSGTEIECLQKRIDQAETVLNKLPKQLEQLRESAAHPTKLMKELRSVGSASERNLHDGQVRLTELRMMIDKAEKARRSIEALINATRRVADNRRSVAADQDDGKKHLNVELTSVQKPDTLTKKIKTLTDAVRQARRESADHAQLVQSPETSETGANTTCDS